MPPADPSALRLGQAARLLVVLGPGDVPARSEHLRLAGRAAGAVGGWAQLRGYLDALDLSSPDARRAVRAAVGAVQPKALLSRRAWNALRSRLPRLPEPEVVGVGEPRKRAAGEEGAAAPAAPAPPPPPAPAHRGPAPRAAAAATAESQPQRREARRVPDAAADGRAGRGRARARASAAAAGGVPAAPAAAARVADPPRPRPVPAPRGVSRPVDDRSEDVADELWDRVRTMAARVAELEAADALGELDEEGRGRLAVLRMRCSRAAERARLADDLADQMAEVRARRRTGRVDSILYGRSSPVPKRRA